MNLTDMGRFGVILCDPPWSYRDLGHTRRIDRQYSIMRTADIAALPVSDMALPDSVLFLWTTVPLLPDGLEVMKGGDSSTNPARSGTRKFLAAGIISASSTSTFSSVPKAVRASPPTARAISQA
jgi:MT-A70